MNKRKVNEYILLLLLLAQTSPVYGAEADIKAIANNTSLEKADTEETEEATKTSRDVSKSIKQDTANTADSVKNEAKAEANDKDKTEANDTAEAKDISETLNTQSEPDVTFVLNQSTSINILDTNKSEQSISLLSLSEEQSAMQLDYTIPSINVAANTVNLDTTTLSFIQDTDINDYGFEYDLASLDVEQPQSLQDQLTDLYNNVAEELDIPSDYVWAVHMLAGGKAVYSSRLPNIYNSLTLASLAGPFEIPNSTYKQEYNLEAPFAVCTNFEIDRQKDGKYYLPDAAYNVMSSIKELMNKRLEASRGAFQVYFDALMPDAKQNICFYESIMLYCGHPEREVNQLYKVYERLLYDKAKDEYVIELTSDGQYKVKDKFIGSFEKYGISDTSQLAIAMSFDGILAGSNTPETVRASEPLHYKNGYTSRENMMAAAMSLVGKVRYVWGGGHGGSAHIDGISPIWECFNELYEQNEKDGYCIQPSGTWCPIHGTVNGACSLSDTTVSTVQDYIELRGDLLQHTSAYSEVLSPSINKIYRNGNLAYSAGSKIAAHRVEGLDCSGFAGWIYNQIDKDRVYDSSARNFVYSGNLQELPLGSELYPGDVIAWSSHIVTVVGKLDDTNKVYIQIEQTPNVIKFGVAYYSGASAEQIQKAKAIAKEANILLGNVKDNWVGCYNMNDLAGSIKVTTDENGEVVYEYSNSLHLGRLKKLFIDEFETVPGYDIPMREMTGQQIIQYTIDNMPDKYISGKNVYTGGIFKYVR